METITSRQAISNTKEFEFGTFLDIK